MRAVSPLLLVSLIFLLAGCATTSRRRPPIPAEYKTVTRDTGEVVAYGIGGSDSGATCTCKHSLGCCPRGSQTGTVKPVENVVGLTHDTAITRLREAGFVNVCCDGDSSHHNHYQAAICSWQECSAPGTMYVDDVVYLCFDAKHNNHPY